MRRNDKEIRDRARIDALLASAPVCRIGFTDGKTPYVVPVHFVHADGALHIHCAPAGRKIDLLRANHCVGFEVDVYYGVVPSAGACKWSSRYESVIGSGRAFIVEDAGEKRRALDRIMAKYTGQTSWDYPEESVARVAVIRIVIDEMTGKQSAMPAVSTASGG